MTHHKEERKFLEKEFQRMGFDKDSRWRISDINVNFELCNTYPRFLIVPSKFKDEDLESVAKFRYFRRIPTAVWRHTKNGCFIVRSSQPTVGWFGWFRNELDENLVQSYIENATELTALKISEKQSDNETDTDKSPLCSKNNELKKTNSLTDLNETSSTVPPTNGNGTPIPIRNFSSSSNDLESSAENNDLVANTTTTVTESTATTDSTTTTNSSANNTNSTNSEMLIIDARSYTAAMANRAKGGGCECSEYYQRCEVHFMNLANIHSIRKSYQAIRSVCEAYSEQSNNWLNFLDNSRWLHHISGLLRSALLVVDTIDLEEKSVMIHCSDGWDRTAQLVALSEIMLDSHYRTFDGFRTLIQREWLDFGHKFADRCGSNPCNEDPNERCPVFLQWLDCLQQLLVQYPKHFEFNSAYLDKLNRHTYSNVFGTFSYNSSQERALSKVDEKTLSLWSYFDSSRDRYRNDNYVESDDILRPSFKVKDLHFWKEVYLPPIRANQAVTATSTSFIPISTIQQQTVPAGPATGGSANGIESGKCCDSLHMGGPTRTVCK